MEDTMKKTIAFLAALVMMASALAGCAGTAASGSASGSASASTSASASASEAAHEPGLFVDGTKVENADPIMTIDGEDVSLDTYRFYYLRTLAMMGGAESVIAMAGDQTEELYTNLRDSAAHSLKLAKVYRDFAAEKGVTVSEDLLKELDNSIAQAKESLGEEEFQKSLEAQYFSTEEEYRSFMQDILLQQQVLIDVYGDEILNNVKENYVHVQHILIPFETEEASSESTSASTSASASGSESTASDDHSAELATAQEVLEKAKNGDDFAALMAEYSQDPGQPEEGYTFTKGYMVQEFEDASYALKEGEISDIVETDYGYHIIKRLPIDEANIKENLLQYVDSNMDTILSTDLQPLMDKVKVEYGEYYDKIAPDTLY